MKGIYIIAIAFLASWTVVTANVDPHQERFILEKEQNSHADDKDEIPTRCPWRDTNETTVHLAHETDCTKFYTCSWGKTHEKDCRFYYKNKRLHFNRREQVCDWPWNAGCISCPGNEEDGYPRVMLSHETNNCDIYYECINGKKKLRHCPDELCFSRTCQACVLKRAKGNCHL